MRAKTSWAFVAAAVLPCVALLAFAAIGLHEWWLISSHQIVVIPAVKQGIQSAPEVAGSRLAPLILGSALLAATFAWALWRGSRQILLGSYLLLVVVIAAPHVLRQL